VLLYAAEETSHVVSQRLAGIAAAACRALADLNIYVITGPSLRSTSRQAATRSTPPSRLSIPRFS